MSDTVMFAITGKSSEISAFSTVVADSTGIPTVSRSVAKRASNETDGRLSQAEMVTMILEFGIETSAAVTAELIKSQFSKFKRARKHMTLEEASSPGEGSAPESG
jgi:hypothetical protein